MKTYSRTYTAPYETTETFFWIIRYIKRYRRTPSVIKPLFFFALQMTAVTEIGAMTYAFKPDAAPLVILWLLAAAHFGERMLEVMARK